MRKWNELEFEWDEEKAAANWKKHGVRFETAAHVFEDENLMEYYDGFHSDGYAVFSIMPKESGENALIWAFLLVAEHCQQLRLQIY